MRDLIITALQNSKLFVVTENQERADAFLREAATRRRDPVKPATMATFLPTVAMLDTKHPGNITAPAPIVAVSDITA